MSKFKNLLKLIVLGLILFGCKKGSEELSPTEKNIPTNKVSITFEGEIKSNDWIQIDDLEKMVHKVDTAKNENFSLLEEGQTSFPQFEPLLLNDLWTSQTFYYGLINRSWRKGEVYIGLPAYSLFLKLTTDKKLANPYKTMQGSFMYAVSFKEFDTYQSWLDFESNKMHQNKAYNKMKVIIIERLDGKPIKIQTSEGYDAKIEYQ